MTGRLLVGLDIGTSAVKAIAVDAESGAVVALATRPLELDTPRVGWAEQDARSYGEGAVECLAELALALGSRRADVASIGLSGQMHTAVLLDAARQPIRPAILWCDGRTTAECANIREKVGDERLAATVGNRPLEGFTLPKLLWLKRNEPESYARLEHVLMPKDYARYRLTGEIATDVSDAAGTLAFEPARRMWSAAVLDGVGVAADVFPRASDASAPAGTLLDAVASATGLPRGTVVAHGAADNAAGAVGLGVVRRGRAMASIGTSGVVLAHADAWHVDPAMRLHAFAHAVPGRFYRMGVMLSAGGALRWYRDVLCDGERLAADLQQVDPYDVIADAASTSRPGAGGVVFLPYLMGERTPHEDAAARGAFVGLGARTTKADISRAVLEGITFGLADSLALLREGGDAATEIRVTGGGAKSPFWRQLMADVFEADVVLTTSAEGPAYGAALLGGVAAGIFSTVEEACDALVHVTRRSAPDPVASARYREAHAVYRGLYEALRPSFAALASMP